MATSAFDRRRINGPEESFSPSYASDDEEDDADVKINTEKPRRGRGPLEIRPIFLKTGLISQANGSAYIEIEKTKIACAVYGPRQSKSSTYNEKGKLNVEVKFAPFSCAKRRAPMRDAEDRSVSVLIQQSLVPAVRLELLPKSTIDVFLFVIENDGIEGCVAAGSVAASTALANAKIDMLGLVVSCAAATVPKDIWLDPIAEEVHAAQGQMGIDEVEKCIDACQERCLDIHSVVAQALLDTDPS
ncbi:ribosomal protein S5 domain 2-like protein [Phellopilus nigrolimitatus]|nr:ribosomal protein S5 domain 2-like protein [Phellopilus nigrolimitatus]